MKKILVIDDNKAMLSILNVFLSEKNYTVKTVSKWPVIEKTIDSFKPDLILLDIYLNGADGGDICRRLKEELSYPMPIILLSAIEMPNKYVKDSNAQGFLHKPFDPSDLLKVMDYHLNVA